MGLIQSLNPSKRLRTVQIHEEDISSQKDWDFILDGYVEYLQHFPFRADEVQTMMLPTEIDDKRIVSCQRCLIRESYKTIGENIIKHSNKWDASYFLEWSDSHEEIKEESLHLALPNGSQNAVQLTCYRSVQCILSYGKCRSS